MKGIVATVTQKTANLGDHGAQWRTEQLQPSPHLTS